MIEIVTAALASALALGGCGRFDFDLVMGGLGGPNGGDGDAAASPRCDPMTPFSAPVPVPGVNSATYDSTFTPVPGELTAYFYSNRAGTHDLYVATRPDLGSAWTAVVIPALSTPSVDKEPAPTPDGRGIVFSSSRPPADAGGDLYFATFDGSTYTLDGAISGLNTGMVDYHPYFQDATTLWFASNRTGTLGMYRSTYSGGNVFSPPVQITDLDVPGYTAEVAVLPPDGLTMYFRSNRPGGVGLDDIWMARRATTADPFANPILVSELESTVLDTPNWISADLCRIYLSSSRTDTSDIFIATRAPL
jgi:Tol biopolymer transport system component